MLHVRIFDPNNTRWEVPDWVTPRSSTIVPASSCALSFQYTKNPFSFLVMRTGSNETLFNTQSNGAFNGLIFEDQYLEISTQLELGANIYGIGEQVSCDPSTM